MWYIITSPWHLLQTSYSRNMDILCRYRNLTDCTYNMSETKKRRKCQLGYVEKNDKSCNFPLINTFFAPYMIPRFSQVLKTVSAGFWRLFHRFHGDLPFPPSNRTDFNLFIQETYSVGLAEWDSCCVQCPGKFQNRERGD